MNERMYELINQCFIGTTDGKLSDLNTVANIEKFAELIVRECANIAYQSLYEDSAFDDSPHNIRCNVMDAIKKHFGVEE